MIAVVWQLNIMQKVDVQGIREDASANNGSMIAITTAMSMNKEPRFCG